MELQTIRTRLSFLLHYNRCIKFENLEIFGNGKLTFHCQFFSLQLNCWSCWCLRYQSLFPSRSNWNGNFQNWVIIPKIQPKKGKKSGINMGAGGVEIAILKLGHSSSNRVLPPLVEMPISFYSKLKERTYKSAAPPSQPAYFWTGNLFGIKSSIKIEPLYKNGKIVERHLLESFALPTFTCIVQHCATYPQEAAPDRVGLYYCSQSNISVYFLTGVICKDSQLRAADSVGGGGEDCLDDGEDCLGHHLYHLPSQSDRCWGDQEALCGDVLGVMDSISKP